MGLLTKEELKTELRITTTDYDDMMDELVVAVQSVFDVFTGRIVEKTTHTEQHSSDFNNSKIYLDNYPILSTASVHDDPDWVYDDDTLIDASKYKINTRTGILFYNGCFNDGFDNVQVIYTAGYVSGTLPAGWRKIWIRQAALWYQESKFKDIAKVMTSQTGGGTVTKKSLERGFLPEFWELIVNESRTTHA